MTEPPVAGAGLPPKRIAIVLAALIACALLFFCAGSADLPPPAQQPQSTAAAPPAPAVTLAALATDAPPVTELVAPSHHAAGESDADASPLPPARPPPPIDLRDPHRVFGARNGWREAVISSLVKSAKVERVARATYRLEQGGTTDDSVVGAASHYYTAARDVLTDPKRRFCQPVPAGHQPLRSRFNMHLDLCYSPAATVTVESSLPVFKMRPHSREVTGVEKMPKVPPGPRHVGCQGVFVLKPFERNRLHICNTTSNTAISPDGTWRTALSAVFGPLHLRLYLDGPELVVGDIQFDEARCVYYAHFRMNSPGSYGVNFKVAHSDFWGVDETHHRTKHNFNKYLVSRGAPNLICRWDGDALLRQAASAAEGSSGADKPRQALRLQDDSIDVAAPHAGDEAAHHAVSAYSPASRAVRHGPDVPRIAVALRSVAAFAAADAAVHRRWVQRPVPVTLFAGRMLVGNTLQLMPLLAGATPTMLPVGVRPKAVPAFGVAPAKGPRELDEEDTGGAPRALAVTAPQLAWHPASQLQAAFRRLHGSPRRSRGLRGLPVQLLVSGDSQSRSVYWALKDYLGTAERYGDEAADALAEVRAAGGITRDQQDADEQARRAIALKKHEKFDHAAAAGEAALSFEMRDAKGEKVKFAQTTFFEVGGADGTGGSQNKAPLVRAYYEWDSYLEKLEANAAKADIIVAGYGSHPASWGQYSFARFRESAHRVARTLCRAAIVDRKPVLYYGCPAWPKMKLVDNFRATNQRLTAMNGIAVAALETECNALQQQPESSSSVWRDIADPAFPVRVVDFFEMTTGVMKLSKDGSHYDGTVVAATLAHEMLGHIMTSNAKS